jgi:exosortase/archaeosortase
MSNAAITNLVAACAGVFGLAAFVGLVAIPAVSSYSRLRERIAAAFLSIYVLAALVLVGVVLGGLVVYEWDRIVL